MGCRIGQIGQPALGFFYLDLGSDIVEKFIAKHIFTKINTITKDPVKSYKTMVQEHLQKIHKELPYYKDSEHEISEKDNVITYHSELFMGEQNI